MAIGSLYHTFQRYRTLQTDKISALPIVILMPHSACNCKCVMCDIWKGNHNLKQLTERDVEALMDSLKRLGTRQVVMSGGEALLNPNFFSFCDILRRGNIRITLLSTGLSLHRHAARLIGSVDDIIISLDGDERLHDSIRNVPGAFRKLKEGVASLHALKPSFRVTGRSVIHRLNFRHWPAIIEAGAAMGLDQLSFLPADVSSEAFNRAQPWDEPRQHEILPGLEELPELMEIIRQIIRDQAARFDSSFIAESPAKLARIGEYYAAFYGLNPFPYKKCNAPWVSAVVEADGTVRPCFFHAPLGNIHENSLAAILNSEKAVGFRKSLDMDADPTCVKCVCYLNLSPRS
ncbi:MAG: radical SAM protein [Bacteroidota bacterium]|nr:radical SAM protein [Bacteroidota bacterium]MDP4215981.1 radical SAM protein [Bacteroidota bacterium]MDP4245096.1 radical SAM protein [Bacteroidota bacterium]MDP4252534.1 radical SAM protein [Bacteroidota bacterium]MDP4257830.1 radical SAM protein [Bacteroidota bacterium]